MRRRFSVKDLCKAEKIMEKIVAARKRRRKLRSILLKILAGLLCAGLLAGGYQVSRMDFTRIRDSSMEPTLSDGDLVAAAKQESWKTGEAVAILKGEIKAARRVIAFGGDWVRIGDEGAVFVNGAMLDEPYLEKSVPPAWEEQTPYQVPEGQILLMSDRRDTENSELPATLCVQPEEIQGKIVFRLLPFRESGIIG